MTPHKSFPNDDLEALLDEAVDRHQSGQLTAAEPLYRRVLAIEPEHWNTVYLLGTLLLQLGRAAESVEWLQRVAEAHPATADAHNNLGIAYKSLGRWEEATRSFQAALKANPEYAQAYFNLGALMESRGMFADAETCYRRAGELDGADVENRTSLANVLKAQGKWDEAEPIYREVAAALPQNLDVRVNLGFVLVQQGRMEEAAGLFEDLLAIDSEFFQLHSNLGYVYERLGRFDDAVRSLQRALQINSEYAEAHNNLGTVYRSMGRLESAEGSYRDALRHNPDFALAEFNLATARLLQGRLEEGWKGYERRFDVRGLPVRPFPQPRWDGSPLGGRTLLLHCEQGLGDTLMFIRYAAVAARRGGSVIVQCQRGLAPLLRSCAGIAQVVEEGEELPPFDVQAPLLSVPGLMGTTLETIPAEIPYLSADAGRTAKWRERLSGLEGVRVGIGWQGRVEYHRDYLRSIPLAQFRPLAEVAGVVLVSLQKGEGVEQLPAARQAFRIEDLGPEVDEDGAFLDTAAAIGALDLVVTSDTALAHLAGALGVPVWLALPLVPDWRWLLDRTDSPWYRTMRLFRQTTYGDWGGVFRSMAEELRGLVLRRGAE